MRRLVLLAALMVLPASAGAHDFALTEVRLALGADGGFTVDVSCDLDALALGVPSSANSATLAAEIGALSSSAREDLVARLGSLLKRRFRVRFDGEPADFDVTLPERGRPPVPGALPSALGLVARLSGRVPAGAREVTLFASRAFPPVRLAVVRPDESTLPIELVERGGESRPVPLAGPAAVESGMKTFGRFLRLGATHILPWGLDHVLFVAGLALLSSRVGPLLAQVTAFTLAHTASLALSSAGIVQLPARVVEPLIALSIAWVGLENALSPRLRTSRLVLVFAFGLLHGLGFAGVLGKLGLPEARRLTALLSFNLGVELGQLAVIALVLGGLRLWTLAGGNRPALVRPASLALATTGLFWTVLRLVGPP